MASRNQKHKGDLIPYGFFVTFVTGREREKAGKLVSYLLSIGKLTCFVKYLGFFPIRTFPGIGGTSYIFVY